MPKLNKKGIELSLSFIVIIIIALVVFAGGMLIVRKIFFGAEELKVTLDEQTEEEIRGLLAGGEIVAVPIAQKTIQVGKQDVFWVAIANVLLEPKSFRVLVGFDEAYTPDGSMVPVSETPDRTYINSNWLLYDSGPYEIAANDNKPVSVLVSVKPQTSDSLSTARGFYAFNVCVLNETVSGARCETDWIRNNARYLYPDQRPRRFIVEVK